MILIHKNDVDTNSAIHAAASAVCALCNCEELIVFENGYNCNGEPGTLDFKYRIDWFKQDGLIKEAQIVTNVPIYDNENGDNINRINDQCGLIAKAFGCKIIFRNNGYSSPGNTRLQITVTK